MTRRRKLAAAPGAAKTRDERAQSLGAPAVTADQVERLLKELLNIRLELGKMNARFAPAFPVKLYDYQCPRCGNWVPAGKMHRCLDGRETLTGDLEGG